MMFPKAPKKKKAPKHLQRVRELGCILCGSPASAHHIRHGQGMSQKADDREAIPLCYSHHQGPQGIHHLGTKAWEKLYGTEEDLLKKTLAML